MKKLIFVPILFIISYANAQIDTILGLNGKIIHDTALSVKTNYITTPSSTSIAFDSTLVITSVTKSPTRDSFYFLNGAGTILFRLKDSTGAGGGGGVWTANGSNIYYNTGNAGLGNTSPTHKFEILDTTITTNSYDSLGLGLINTKAATVGNVKNSPPLVFLGSTWNTATAASNSVQAKIYYAPVQGTGGTLGGNLNFDFKENNGTVYTGMYLGKVAGANATLNLPLGGIIAAGPISAASFSGPLTWANSAALTYTNQWDANNNTEAFRIYSIGVASAGTPSIYSRGLRMGGLGWSGSASQAANFNWYVKPNSGTSPITANFVLQSQIGAGSYADKFFFSDGGALTANQYRLSALNTAPASSTDTGTLGEIRITSTYIYICIATNSWVRSALATW